jgi:hypothetical protein
MHRASDALVCQNVFRRCNQKYAAKRCLFRCPNRRQSGPLVLRVIRSYFPKLRLSRAFSQAAIEDRILSNWLSTIPNPNKSRTLKAPTAPSSTLTTKASLLPRPTLPSRPKGRKLGRLARQRLESSVQQVGHACSLSLRLYL